MVFNYICAALFIIFFIAFVVFQGGISKHLNMCKWLGSGRVAAGSQAMGGGLAAAAGQ